MITAPTKHAPSLNVHVHRLRHLDYRPAKILAMAVSPCRHYVVLSRANGHTEAYQVGTAAMVSTKNSVPVLHPLATIAGYSNAVAHSMVMLSSHESVAASPDGSLWLLDWQRRQSSGRMASGGGGVYQLATLTMGSSSSSVPNIVAAACHDGSVRFFHVKSHRLVLSLIHI